MKIELPTKVGQPIIVDGQEFPSKKYWEMMIKTKIKPSVEDVENIIKNAVYYRYEKMCVLLLVPSHKVLDTDAVLTSREYVTDAGDAIHWALVVREEDQRPRPLLREYGGMMLRNEGVPTPEVVIAVILREVKKRLGLEATALADKLFFMTPANRSAIYKRFKIYETVGKHREQLVRLGVLLKRTSGLEVSLEMAGRPFPKAKGDGLVAVVPGLQEPLQGTWLAANKAAKGIVRPPFKGERAAFCQTGEFGTEIHEGDVGTFHTARRLTRNRASINLQALVFSTSETDACSFIEEDTRRLAAKKPIDLVRPHNRAKVEAGVPAGLLMDVFNPWKWLTRFRIRAISAPVFCYHKVPCGSFRLLPDSAAEMESKGLKKGAVVRILRDPAKPDHSAILHYTYDGVVEWSSSTVKFKYGVVLNPEDPRWKLQGGDFDGDNAVVMMDLNEVVSPIHDVPSHRMARPIPMVVVDNKYSVPGTILALRNTFAASLGSVVNLAMKFAEFGLMTPEKASIFAGLIQDAVDSKKHPVDSQTCQRIFDELRDEWDAFLAEDFNGVDPSFKEACNVMDKQPGGAGWDALKIWRSTQVYSELGIVLAERIDVLDNLFRDSGFIRGHRLTLPQVVRDTARAKLHERDDAEIQIAKMRAWTKGWRDALGKLAEIDNPEDRQELRERIDILRIRLMNAYTQGVVCPWAIIAHGPSRIAAEIVSADDFRELACATQQAIITVEPNTLQSGEAGVTAIRPTPASRHEFDALTAGVEVVKVDVVERGDKYDRVMISTVSQRRFVEPTLVDDGDDTDPMFC